MKATKVIAFYLPQFHEIPENNNWWGQGFTEWTNTKKAKPLFKGHYQPKEPLNDNYYCLLDEDTQIWQAQLAQKYGIDGFCYYHYWFNGKLLLEKPMENMLNNKKITIPFCISWANETWSRTWTGMEKQVLIEQKYGGKEDWKRHIEYLLPFFKDERYIKIDNKPLMLLYTSSKIAKCEEMVVYWDKYLKKLGFNGIFIAETLNYVNPKPILKNSSAAVEFEPNYMLRILGKKSFFYKVKRYICRKIAPQFNQIDALKIWNKIENYKWEGNKKIFRGTFVSWDNSARRGEKGTIYKNTSPNQFEKHFYNLFEKAKRNGDQFVFINAWNEWAEGAYLEPDKRYGYQYLESIKRSIDGKIINEKNN